MEKVWWRRCLKVLKKATYQITVTNMLTCIKPEIVSWWILEQIVAEYRPTIINIFLMCRAWCRKKWMYRVEGKMGFGFARWVCKEIFCEGMETKASISKIILFSQLFSKFQIRICYTRSIKIFFQVITPSANLKLPQFIYSTRSFTIAHLIAINKSL